MDTSKLYGKQFTSRDELMAALKVLCDEDLKIYQQQYESAGGGF